MRAVTVLLLLALAVGLSSGCSSASEDEEERIACGIQADTQSCICAPGDGGDRKTCTAADVGGGACFGSGDYCACRPWRCVGTAEPCSCEFGGAHVTQECTGVNCCFFPDQNGGFCNCVDEELNCLGKAVADCSFETIAPLLANTDGTFPRVDQCPL